MFRSPVRSIATVAFVSLSLVAAGAVDAFAQRGGGGGGSARTSGGGAGGRGGAVPAGSVRRGGQAAPAGPAGRGYGSAVPRGSAGRPNGQAVVVSGRYAYNGYRYCCGYYGYPYGYYSPWYGWGAGVGWGWGAGWGFSVGFSWGYPYPSYYGYPYPYAPYYYSRYAPAPAPASGYVDATNEQRTPVPDQVQQPSASFGTISMRVQPTDAEVIVDGETWTSPETSRLVIQLAPGRHRIAVRKTGFDSYTEDVLIRVGATMTLNVSLLRGQK